MLEIRVIKPQNNLKSRTYDLGGTIFADVPDRLIGFRFHAGFRSDPFTYGFDLESGELTALLFDKGLPETASVCYYDRSSVTVTLGRDGHSREWWRFEAIIIDALTLWLCRDPSRLSRIISVTSHTPSTIQE
jgi:hypothetical protein